MVVCIQIWRGSGSDKRVQIGAGNKKIQINTGRDRDRNKEGRGKDKSIHVHAEIYSPKRTAEHPSLLILDSQMNDLTALSHSLLARSQLPWRVPGLALFLLVVFHFPALLGADGHDFHQL